MGLKYAWVGPETDEQYLKSTLWSTTNTTSFFSAQVVFSELDQNSRQLQLPPQMDPHHPPARSRNLLAPTNFFPRRLRQLLQRLHLRQLRQHLQRGRRVIQPNGRKHVTDRSTVLSTMVAVAAVVVTKPNLDFVVCQILATLVSWIPLFRYSQHLKS